MTSLFMSTVEDLLGAIPSWQKDAQCGNLQPEAWWPERGVPSPYPETYAKRICRGCPVKAECLEHALANKEEFGIWGGLTEGERRGLKRRAA